MRGRHLDPGDPTLRRIRAMEGTKSGDVIYSILMVAVGGMDGQCFIMCNLQ